MKIWNTFSQQKVLLFCVWFEWSSALSSILSLIKQPQRSVLWVLWSLLSTLRRWRQWLLLLLSCSYGELDEYCGVSLWDCAGYNKAKRKAPFELQLIGQRDYPCMSLTRWAHQFNSNSHHPQSLNTTHWSSPKTQLTRHTGSLLENGIRLLRNWEETLWLSLSHLNGLLQDWQLVAQRSVSPTYMWTSQPRTEI